MAWEKMRTEFTVKRAEIEAEVETKLTESETPGSGRSAGDAPYRAHQR